MSIPTPVPPDVKLITERHCPSCGYTFTAVGTGDQTDATDPTPGDRTVCMNCVVVLIFDETLTPRDLTPDEWATLSVQELGELAQLKARIRTMHAVLGPPGSPTRES